MDYEKAYKDALERARKVKHDVQSIGCSMNTDMLGVIFPELAESEDEKIRNIIRKVLITANDGDLQTLGDDELNRCLAWLENQKEYIDDIRQYAYNKGLVDAEEKQKSAELPKSEDYGIDGLYAAIDILQRTLGEVDGYQTDDGILEHKCAISAVKELYEQKPAEWREEDESYLEEIIDDLKFCKKNRKSCREGLIEDCIGWLNNRVKSLRPHPHWKPSEEQTDVDLDKLVNEEFASHSRTTEYGLEATYNRTELYKLIKRMALVFNARKSE